MNKKIALCLALLKGDIINVSNCIKICGYSNPAREIPREIEIPFGVSISRIRMTSKDQFGNAVTWVNYRLNRDADYNQVGIVKLREYIREHLPKESDAKTEAQKRQFKQTEMFLNHKS